MFDECLEPPQAERLGSPAQAVQASVTSAGTPLSTFAILQTTAKILESLNHQLTLGYLLVMLQAGKDPPRADRPGSLAQAVQAPVTSAEFVNHTMTEYYERISIFHQKTVSRTPQQNGVVERRNRTLVEAARTMLIFSKASMFLWTEAVATACYTQNRSLIHTRYHNTPYELVHNRKPDLTFFGVFGALCYPTNNSEDLGKLKPSADTGIFVGYAPSRE
nr:retrovirus-related Pol polyprotein from transposon TNT 1-94 [Tanacetum cinerariifolium]